MRSGIWATNHHRDWAAVAGEIDLGTEAGEKTGRHERAELHSSRTRTRGTDKAGVSGASIRAVGMCGSGPG
jgi:hypothetical protein